MYSSSYSSSRSGLRYYPVSSSSGYPRSRFDEDPFDQEYLFSRHGRNEHSNGVRNQSTHGGRSTDASRSRYGVSGRTTHSSGYGSSYVPSRGTGDSARTDSGGDYQDYSRIAGSSSSRVSTRASTVHPGDSISNIGRRPHRQRDAEARSRSVAPVGHGRQSVFEVYPQTLRSSIFSRHYSHSSRTFDSGPTYRYVPRTRGEVVPEVASNVSSSSIAHPFAYDDSGRTHTWHPPPRYQFSETGRRSRRSDAPSPDFRASHGQAAAGTYRSMASGGTRLPQRSVYGYPPLPTTVLLGRSGGNFSSISSHMEDAAYDSDVEHLFS